MALWWRWPSQTVEARANGRRGCRIALGEPNRQINLVAIGGPDQPFTPPAVGPSARKRSAARSPTWLAATSAP